MNDRFTNRTLRAAALAAAALMSGCATGPRIVHTEVTSFNEFADLPPGRSYVFARTLEYQNSLEMKSYEAIVRDELATRGFTLVGEPTQADLTVTLRPSVTNTRVVLSRPWGGDPWSFGGFYGRGYGGYGGYGGFGYPFGGPFYGGGPSYGGGFYGGPYGGGYGGFDDIDVFRQRLELDIDSRTTTGKRYYEGKVETTSRTGSPTTAMRYLIRALFVDFPGNNGQTRRVDIAADAK